MTFYSIFICQVVIPLYIIYSDDTISNRFVKDRKWYSAPQNYMISDQDGNATLDLDEFYVYGILI